MQSKRPIFVVVALLVVALLAGTYYIYNLNRPVNTALTASGTVETTDVPIAPEMFGRINEINVREGDVVKAGDVLFQLDDSLLKAQRAIAAASLEGAKAAVTTAQSAVASAQSQYDISLDASRLKDQPVRTQDWYKTQKGEFTLPEWYYSQDEQIKAAQVVVDDSNNLVAKAQKKLTTMQSQAGAADFIQAESDLAAAQANYSVAIDLYNRAWFGADTSELSKRQVRLVFRDNYLDSKNVDKKWVTLTASVNKDLRDEAQNIYDDATTVLDDAQKAYDDAVSSDTAKDILKLRAQLSMDLERLNTAQDYVRKLQTGSENPATTAAHKLLDHASAAAAQAATSVTQAQANLDLIDAQMAKTTVIAPVDGVVLTRSGEPGSVVNPGSTVLILGRLEELTITVYVPEDRMGEVSLGQTASVSVDSFPGQVFDATVTYISNQAEFTPRNVQTTEGRKTTVFAIKLNLTDASGKLKPGMPADVLFK